MRKKEQRLWDRFSAALTKADIIAERVENLVAKGTPDCYGVGWWCELKAVDAPPARPTTPLLGKGDGLSVDQINWHLWWAQARGTSYVLIGVGSRENYLLPGSMAAAINELTYTTVRANALARCIIGRNNWADITKELQRENQTNVAAGGGLASCPWPRGLCAVHGHGHRQDLDPAGGGGS